ncbi:hypothetical protein [Absidia glauca]|uniref:Haloacid dehalogenase, type II n=1 Tax=Absidia glauca TaxID=4829 RepID=A0A168P0H0_ABSGL|nr:hypothetical protein [Absidia glauca]
MPTIVFDFLGTLVRFDAVITTIETIWQQKGLEDHEAAKALFEDWYRSSLMDYVAASHSGLYQPFLKVLRGTLARTLYRRLAIVPSEDHVEQVMWAFRHRLDAATEALEALLLALDEGWAVWIITLADQDDTWEFLKQQGIDGSLLWMMSCDEYKVATPHPKIYAQVMRLTVRHTQKIENFYMVSSHAWELEGAKNVSMRTVFLTHQELIYPSQVYNDKNPDLQGDSLMDCVKKVLSFERSLNHYYLL